MATRSDYALASLERLKEARLLIEAGAYGGAIYLAGRAAESILKAYIEADVKEIKGHNLNTLSRSAKMTKRLRPEARLEVEAAIEEASLIWSNEFRYRSTKNLERIGRERNVRFLVGSQLVRFANLDHNGIREWAERLFNLASQIVQEGYKVWQSKKS